MKTSYRLGRNLKDIGVIGGLDMTTEAISTKLAFLLSKPGITYEKVHYWMHQKYVFTFQRKWEIPQEKLVIYFP